MVFRKDLISVMEKIGGIPESSMDSYVKTIEERNKLDGELAQAQEEISQLISAAGTREKEIAQAQEEA